MPWNGSSEQVETLKAALDELASNRTPDAALAVAISRSEALRKRYPELSATTIDRATLYRWRTDIRALRAARFQTKMLVYNFLEDSKAYPTDAFAGLRPSESFFGHCATFFSVKQASTVYLSRSLKGRFQFYRYSQSIPHSMVIGSFDIDRRKDGSVSVSEKQKYDGKLKSGLPPMSDEFDGLGFQRNSTIYFLMRHSSPIKTPQFYIFDDFHDNPDGIPFLKGYLLKGSRDGTLFRSPVFVRRIEGGEQPILNIIPCTDKSVHDIIAILTEIELSVWHAVPRTTKNRP